MPRPVDPVTADDLDRTVQLAIAVLREVPPEAWEEKAGSLEWTCWETVEHLANAFFSYATRLAPKEPPLNGRVPFPRWSRRAGGPQNAVHADPDAGPAGLLQVLDACGGLLVAMVRTASPEVRAHHPWGVSNPEGFAAMGIVETLVHTHDLAEGLDIPWEPSAALCSRALHRLFPGTPDGTEPWPALLWATGRTSLPGRPLQTSWRWHAAPRP
ncbi:DinB family protein [Actinomadura formosensis]|uniref:DinB family protein n=1 Tax=Actinomadura formosensis TaxID=60706 RepID=UPI00082BA462|nr:DinB family protein [Actinomadura formosensis]